MWQQGYQLVMASDRLVTLYAFGSGLRHWAHHTNAYKGSAFYGPNYGTEKKQT